MNLGELTKKFREDADDNAQPYLFAQPWVTDRLNEAVAEACLRARLIHESDDASVCSIAVSAGKAGYPLDPSLYEITHVAFRAAGETVRTPILLVSTEWLDDNVRDWRDSTDTPLYAIQADTAIRLVPMPAVGGTLLLEGFRLPLEPMSASGSEPEIHTAHHRHLVHWALYAAFSNPDVDFYDKARSDRAEAEFTRYFGPRPDADLRRVTRHDTPQHVVPFLP